MRAASVYKRINKRRPCRNTPAMNKWTWASMRISTALHASAHSWQLTAAKRRSFTQPSTPIQTLHVSFLNITISDERVSPSYYIVVQFVLLFVRCNLIFQHSANKAWSHVWLLLGGVVLSGIAWLYFPHSVGFSHYMYMQAWALISQNNFTLSSLWHLSNTKSHT